ncbi:MAG: 2-dehydropantoate 2-reductase [Hyphomicrobiales bacterium]|nr:2-dehydropantoate 2-reductase [Hyphomicrobiales bacterium]
MRLLIVGAGATGGYFGGRLAAAGRDVTFLVREKRAEQLRRDGLVIQSPHGDLTLQPKFVTAGELKAAFDAILVTVKAYALTAAMDDIAPAVGPQTMIVPVLNGMRHIEDLQQRFGADKIVGGVCRIASMLDDKGHILQLADFQDVVYGELDGSTSSRTQGLHQFMQGAGFNAQLSSHIRQDLWNKWIMLAGMGVSTTLMRGSVGDIEAAGGVPFVHAVIDEIAGVAAAHGHAPAPGYIEVVRGMLTKKGSPMASSMYRDLMQGLPIEADHIVGDLVSRAREKGVKTPLLEADYINLCVYQNRLKR